MVASSTLSATNAFVNGPRGQAPSKLVFNHLSKATDCHGSMADAAGLGNVTRAEMCTVLKLITGKYDNHREAALALLTLGKGVIPWGYENNMRAARTLDKIEYCFSIMGVEPTSGFQDCYEAASAAVPREAPNREKLLHLWFALVIFKVAEASRASKARGDSQAVLKISEIEVKEQHFLNLIRQGTTPVELESSFSIFAKFEGSIRKEEGDQGGAKQRAEHGSTQSAGRQQFGCSNFVSKGQCSFGAAGKLVHSNQAKCPHGATCTFLSTPRVCSFVGPNSN
jgi:hypothetical protein